MAAGAPAETIPVAGGAPAETIPVAAGAPAETIPVAAGAPAGHVPPAPGTPSGHDPRPAGAPAGHRRLTGVAAGLALAGRSGRGEVLPTGGPGGFAPGVAPGQDLSAPRTAVIEHTEILMRPAMSVIICAFTEDRWEDLCGVLGSVRAQTEPPGEIILVIDHCPPLLRRARLAFPEVTVVPNHFQKGLAGGRNTGVAHAWGDVVAFIDDDAVAGPDWLARLADHYLDPTVLGVGGLVEPAWEHRRPGWFPPELDWVVGCSYLGMRSGLGPVRNFIGANMSFRREILAEIGGFSIELGRVDSNPFGCEETELCLRVSQRHPGAILLYEPAASVRHRVRRHRARWRYLRARCYAEGRSKATVASLAGAEPALASERSYVRSTIPRGVCRSLLRALRGRPSGLLSAFALVLAVFTTGFGYVVGRRASRKNPAGVPAVDSADGEVLDAEAWVLESDRAAPDEQTWVLDPEDWLPPVDDWAPDRAPEEVNGGTQASPARPETAVGPETAAKRDAATGPVERGAAPEAAGTEQQKPPAPDASRGTLNGHGATLAPGFDMRVAVPETQVAEPGAPAHGPAALTAQPQTRAAEPEAPAAEPEARVAEPEAPAPEPEVPAAEPEARVAEPEVPAAEPEVPAAEPEARVAEPEAPAAPPEARVAEPEAPAAEPEVPAAEPEAPAAEPEARVAEPEVPAAEPEVPAAPPEARVAEPEAPAAEPEAVAMGPKAAAAEPEALVIGAEPGEGPDGAGPLEIEWWEEPLDLKRAAVAMGPEAAITEPEALVIGAEPGEGPDGAGPLEIEWWEEPVEPAIPRGGGRAPIRTWFRNAVRRGGRVAGLLFPWACLAVVAGLWVTGLNRVQAGRVATAGFGLMSVLPVTFWAASALLMLSFCWTVVRWPGRWPALAAHLVALVALLHATPAVVYGTLRYSWAWKHVGVVDYIIHHGIDFRLGGVLGVYQGWPGFFALNAFFTRGGGLQSALGYAPWALAIDDLLWLGPILLIARAFTADRRMIWAAAWVFELGNWVGQDYFSPQAFAFFLFLTVIAVCLRWLGDDRPRRRWIRAALVGAAGWARGHAPRWLAHSRPADQAPPRPTGDRAPPSWPGGRALGRRARKQVRWERAAEGSLWYQVAKDAPPELLEIGVPAEGAGVSRPARLALVVALVPLTVAIASSHQLTPVMLVIALAVLAVFRHLRPRVLLPLVAAAIVFGWMFYGGLPWLQANSQIFDGFGALWANSSAHVVGGGQAAPDQVIVAWGSRLLSTAIGLLAIAGFLRYRRHRDKAARRSWNRVALLGVAAIPMVAGNSYGGEIIFRAFLFALPFMAVAGAALFFPRPWSPHRYLAAAALTVTTILLAAGFFLANYGTDAMNYFTPQEVAASQWLYRTAPAGAQVIAVNSNFPWAFVHYNRYTYTFLDGSGYSSATLRGPVQEISFLMSPPYPKVSYLVFTRSQAAQEAISGPWSANQVARVYDALMRSSAFKTVYRAKGVTILRLARSLAPAPASPAARRAHHRRAVPGTHGARTPRQRARLRALRARYARHHPPTIGGRPEAP